MLIPDLLRISAEKYGDKCFANSSEEYLNFNELNYFSDKLATKLRKLGKKITIGILSKNSLQYLISYFAIIKSGNIAVAINPLNKGFELGNIIADSEIKVLFTNNYYLSAILSLDHELTGKITCFNFDEDYEQLKGETCFEIKSFNEAINSDSEIAHENAIGFEADENDIVQIIFTSGTKGSPNGVCLTHKNLIANMEQILDRIDINEDDNMLVIIPFYYSYGNSLILSHLFRGARLTINNNSLLPTFILDDLVKKKCTSMAGVASNFILLIKRSKFINMGLPHLRYVTLAGEPIADWIITEMQTMPIDIYVMYGQTEATARISILKPDELNIKEGSVGRPVKETDLKIVDSDGSILPPNEFGEVIISGLNIMKGYWKDPDSTANKFLNSYLYTGDFGKLDKDGYLYISGRMDEMIKVGGERVFPIEIEKALLRHEKVAEAGVIGIKEITDDESLSDYIGKTIYAFVVPKEDLEEELTEIEIFCFCKENLPRYKIPGHIIFANKLPRTATGKLNRNMLAGLVK